MSVKIIVFRDVFQTSVLAHLV